MHAMLTRQHAGQKGINVIGIIMRARILRPETRALRGSHAVTAAVPMIAKLFVRLNVGGIAQPKFVVPYHVKVRLLVASGAAILVQTLVLQRVIIAIM